MVIDLYGKPEKKWGDGEFGPNSMTQIMSSGKSVASILLAKMYEKGVMSYDEKVSTYWPEFAQNGKDKIEVADVMRHEAGLHRMYKTLETEDCWPANIKNNSIGSIIEQDTSIWHEGFPRRYHAVSRDWISNEIFRRVDPEGRTMGEFLKEIRSEFGIDIICGVTEDELKLIHPYKFDGKWKMFKNACKGPKKAPTLAKLSELPKIVKDFKEIAKKDAELYEP